MSTNKRFFPVIHCVSPFAQNGLNGIGHALANVRIAKENGADGVFLIGHDLPSSDLICIYEQARKQHPDFYIGVNFLDIEASNTKALGEALKRCPGVNALWMDGIPRGRITNNTEIEYFAGVAFKYRDPNPGIPEIKRQCRATLESNSHIVTSGSVTGSAPKRMKIKVIRDYAGPERRIAIASGISAENVDRFLDIANDFLVASSISKRNLQHLADYLVPEKVDELARMIHTG